MNLNNKYGYFLQVTIDFDVSMHKLAEFSVSDQSEAKNITDSNPIWKRRCNFQGHELKSGWIVGLPYIYMNDNSTEGNIAGVNYDLSVELAKECNFTLSFEKIDVYGAEQKNGSWTGLMKKLINKDLDIGIADLSITFERAQQIDFSVGIHDSEYSLFMKIKTSEPLRWETFTEAFSNGFWFCLFTLIISLTIFLSIMKFSSNGKILKLQYTPFQKFLLISQEM